MPDREDENMAAKAFIPPPIGDQDHIIRRLGWAVVRHWSSLPGDVQADVYQQALYVQDKKYGSAIRRTR
jgi:hypothetical protein